MSIPLLIIKTKHTSINKMVPMKNRNRIYFHLIILLGSFILLTSSCNKDDSDPSVNHKLGESYKGGIIFSLDASGKHGLIAATTDQSSSDPWFNGSAIASLLFTTGASSSSNGSANTNTIIQEQGNNGNYAARLCSDFKGGGFKDWFLPSKDQLNILYNQKTLVGGFSDKIYWTSTEYDMGFAWVQNFLDGEQNHDYMDNRTNCTRAIRAF
jgi:hypothetical protein